MGLLIGKRFVVSRGSGDFDSGGRLPIILAHGRAFGSGEHETTCSCLEELEGVRVLPTTRVLDLGSGTGILAVAAARMGARSVIALEPDADAVKATSATIRLNRMDGMVTPVQGEIGAIHRTDFDLIMANLYGDVLLCLAHEITSLLAPGACLLMSGIQYADAYDIRTRYTWAGCTFLKASYLEEYVTMSFRH